MCSGFTEDFPHTIDQQVTTVIARSLVHPFVGSRQFTFLREGTTRGGELEGTTFHDLGSPSQSVSQSAKAQTVSAESLNQVARKYTAQVGIEESYFIFGTPHAICKDHHLISLDRGNFAII